MTTEDDVARSVRETNDRMPPLTDGQRAVLGVLLRHRQATNARKEAEMNTSTETRSLSTIAADISQHWPTMYFGAVPYVKAMKQLDKISDSYGCEDARSIVLYFLSNATTWRGEDARRIKAELKQMLKGGR